MNTDLRRYEAEFQITNCRFQILKKSVFICVHLWLISFFCAFFAPLREIKAQVRPVYDYGATGLAQALKRLNTTKSVLMIGAHPDDEDSALLAYLARGENARTAYLSLTRGDGGQNIIGSELFEPLGIIRTEELLQARRLDGAEQFFTRAFDFGFTKTLAETKQKWDERVILCDTVRVIRTFRPLVVISRFSGTVADGHGQHQYAGYISPLAVRAAADSNQCKDAGAPWQVLKFYVEQGFRDTKEPTLKINTGAYDFLLGRSYYEIAAEGRSRHETQEQGNSELRGEQFSGLNLKENNARQVENETSVFDGIITTITGIPKGFQIDGTENFSEIQTAAERALKEYEPDNPQKIVPVLVEGLRAIRQYRQKFSGSSPDFLNEKEKEFTEAIRRASGIAIDALADREIVASGESFQASVKIFFPKSDAVKVREIALKTPNGWAVSKIEAPKENAQAFRRETANEANYFSVRVSPKQKPTEPYWLESQRQNDLFVWSADENQTLPFQPPLASAEVKIEIGGLEIAFSQPIEFRYADNVRGEIRRDLNVAPALSVSLDQKLLIVPTTGRAHTRRVVMNITNLSDKPIEATASLCAGLIGGWKSAPESQIFNLKNKGETTAIAFEFIVPTGTKPGSYTLLPAVVYSEGVLSDEMRTLSYAHIQTHRFYTQVSAKVTVLDLKVAPVRVGYIAGSGDEVADAIRRMGVTVDLLSETDLRGGDLSKYGAIVVGVRAYQVRQDLLANNQRILDFVKNGGTLIVQYQRPDYVRLNLQPFPASMTDTQKTTAGTTARVVDENAKVTILQPTHPAFNFPNKITDADFAGWVQERNLYNFTTFDEKYTPLLEAHDAGELENKGGMIFAKIGKGNYVYTSYSFFRQLPNGVSGAYRLFANLLALPKANKK